MSKALRDFVDSRAEAQEQVTTNRPCTTALFAIDSDDRYQTYQQRRSTPSYPFSFGIQKNEALLNGFFSRMGLTELRMNWTLPNISAAWGNNTISMTYASTSVASQSTKLLTVADGFYGSDELAQELQKQMRANGLPNARVWIQQSEDDCFRIVPNEQSLSWVIRFNPVQGADARQLIDMLNIPNPTSTAMNEFILSGVPNLRPMDYLDIVCTQLTYNQSLKDSTSAATTRDVLSRIYLDEPVQSSALVQSRAYAGGDTTGNVYLNYINSIAYVQNNVACFITAIEPHTDMVGSLAVISGITGASSYLGTARVIRVSESSKLIVVEYPAPLTGTPTVTAGSLIEVLSIVDTTTVPQTRWSDHVNGVTPFVLYRQWSVPKWLKWNRSQPVGQVKFELYDDQGRSIQELWEKTYPASSVVGQRYANSFVFNFSILVTEE
jgi:hypothetical protein